MKILDEKYLIVADGEVIKSYSKLKPAMWDLDFFELMYKNVSLYQKVVQDGKEIK